VKTKGFLHPVGFMLVVASVAAGEITRDEALKLAYPGATVRAERVFLTTSQLKQASARAREPIESPLVARYIATSGGQVVGRAYVDTHVVRTKKETLLISLHSTSTVKRIDVTAFLEPGEYRAPDPWLKQYEERPLADQLQVNRSIRPIAGATLTARAVNSAVRRVLAIDAVIESGVSK
jgi:hypothetical protein